MESVRQRLEDMISSLRHTLEDADRHEKGNFAAGVRIRKSLQEVAKSCKETRNQVREERASK